MIRRDWMLLALLWPGISCGLAAAENWTGYERLSGDEIRQVFADVRDAAEVQDSAGTIAVNHWFADGTFTTQWAGPGGTGKAAGRWYTRDDYRCVVIAAGLPGADRKGTERCGRIYRKAQQYFSVNPDGSVHGIHRLTPIQRIEPPALSHPD